MADSQGDSLNTDSEDKVHCPDSEDLGSDLECGNDFVSENSTQLPINQSNHPHASNVDEMKYPEVIALMTYFEKEITESGPKDRSVLKEYLNGREGTGSYEDKMQDTVSRTMKKYIDEKKKLYETYSEIQTFARTDAFQKEVSHILQKGFPDYMEQLQKKTQKLKTDEIEIYVIGCTCAGKSTFFNILLREDIMPTKAVPNTTCRVRLHNSKTRQIQLKAEDKVLETETLKADMSKSDIKSYLEQRCFSDKSVDAVDLYWPIPILDDVENVVFVDTPGIGDNNSMTEKVIEDVPKAAGYIFIIDSTNGGGILEGGIVKLFDAIAKGEKEKNIANVLFVSNKWDLIKTDDRKTVWDDTRKRLKEHFGDFEDWQIIRFSSYVELKLMQLGGYQSDDFVKILVGLERLMSRTIKKRVLDFYRWINDLIEKSAGIIKTQITYHSLSADDINRNATEAEEILKELKMTLDRNSEKIETAIGMKKAELIKDLQEYLKSPAVQQEACDWGDHVPESKDFEKKAPELVNQRIHTLISKWAGKEEGLLKKGIADITKECRELEAEIGTRFASINEMKIECCPTHNVEVSKTPLIATAVGIAATEGATIGISAKGITAALSGRVALVVGAALVPVAIGVCVGISIWMTKSGREKKMIELTKEAMANISSNEAMEKVINTLFERDLKESIEQFRAKKELEIASTQELLRKLKTNLRSETDLLTTLEPLLCQCMHYL